QRQGAAEEQGEGGVGFIIVSASSPLPPLAARAEEGQENASLSRDDSNLKVLRLQPKHLTFRLFGIEPQERHSGKCNLECGPAAARTGHPEPAECAWSARARQRCASQPPARRLRDRRRRSSRWETHAPPGSRDIPSRCTDRARATRARARKAASRRRQ